MARFQYAKIYSLFVYGHVLLKTFIPAPPDDEACGCNNCRYMKMITLENIFTTLRDERPEISLDEEVRRRAERSILNMIAIK